MTPVRFESTEQVLGELRGHLASRGAPPLAAQVAATIDGYVGFAIGRSIWWDPLTDHLAGTISADVAQARITQAYLDYANDYMAARARG